MTPARRESGAAAIAAFNTPWLRGRLTPLVENRRRWHSKRRQQSHAPALANRVPDSGVSTGDRAAREKLLGELRANSFFIHKCCNEVRQALSKQQASRYCKIVIMRNAYAPLSLTCAE
jgi:hypothetical protein